MAGKELNTLQSKTLYLTPACTIPKGQLQYTVRNTARIAEMGVLYTQLYRSSRPFSSGASQVGPLLLAVPTGCGRGYRPFSSRGRRIARLPLITEPDLD